MPRGRDDAGRPRYGEREVTAEDVEALSRMTGEPFHGFLACLHADGSNRDPATAAAFDAAFAWLSANATGPWQWHDHVRPSIHVERASDQDAFVRAHGTLFGYQAPTRAALARLAVLRGALPPLTALESFDAWRREHAGFLVAYDVPDAGRGECHLLFDHPGMEAAFLHGWSNLFVRGAGEATYSGPANARDGRGQGIGTWLKDHSCLGEPVIETEMDIGECTLDVRYADVADALERDWGYAFLAEPGDRETFVAASYPGDPVRPLPDDFSAWLRGEREDYEAPYLPEGMRSRDPSPRP